MATQSSLKKAKPKNGNTKLTPVSPTIRGKDEKLLWSRAAGRCSMPDCRQQLTLDVDHDKSVTLGEMCHIVGERPLAARGKSNFPREDRFLYSNLILLCAHHHTIIDRHPAKYSVEVLHKMKSDHELWVAESLSAKKIRPENLVYSTLIDNISIALKLDQWTWSIDNAVRHFLHEDFIDAADFIMERQLATIWPGTQLELESATRDLMASFLKYVQQYLSFAAPASSYSQAKYFAADTSYKRISKNPDYSTT